MNYFKTSRKHKHGNGNNIVEDITDIFLKEGFIAGFQQTFLGSYWVILFVFWVFLHYDRLATQGLVGLENEEFPTCMLDCVVNEGKTVIKVAAPPGVI